MDILFGQSYFLRFDTKLYEAMQPYPPLGTLYAAAIARQAGYEVALFDSMLSDSTGEWDEAITTHQPRFAIIYEDNFNYLSKMCLLNMRAAAFEMIASAKSAGCCVIVSGADPTDHFSKYLDQGADYVLIGEGEETLIELLDHLDNNVGTLKNILGLAYAHDGKIQINPHRPEIKHLDSLPLPAWDLVDIPRYRTIWLERHNYFSLNLVTTRGCPFHCNWCAKPIWGQRYNSRSPEQVALEMKYLKDEFAPDHIWFADDILGLKPGWLEEFAHYVERHAAHTPFKCLSRADLLLREGDISALAAAGCKIVWIGAESGSQKILNAMDKGTRVEQIYQAASELRANGVQVGFFLQFGYPGETMSDIELTLKMVRECQPDDIGFSVSYPLPGTKFHMAVQNELQDKQNWVDSNDLAVLFEGEYPSHFYRILHDVVHSEFRARKIFWQLVARKKFNAKTLLRAVYYWFKLVFLRTKLNRLAKLPHESTAIHVQSLSPEEASLPSDQKQASHHE